MTDVACWRAKVLGFRVLLLWEVGSRFEAWRGVGCATYSSLWDVVLPKEFCFIGRAIRETGTWVVGGKGEGQTIMPKC